MKKNYVLDTNVLLHDPQSLFKFEDNDLFIPIYVIEEIDSFKRDSGERGRNARSVVRNLDALRAEGGGCLADGVKVGDGGSLRVYVPERRPTLEIALKPASGDNLILQTAVEISSAAGDVPTVFVTMDVSLRIRADALGLATEAYENQTVNPDRLESAVAEVAVTGDELTKFFKEGRLPLDRSDIHPNGSVMLSEAGNHDRTGLGRYDVQAKAVRQLITPREGVAGIRPRNREQAFALDLLLDDNVKLVTLIGSAGTGKTLLALAAGISRVVEAGAFTRLLISRPVMPLGRDLGYLPGDVEEKLGPWMQPLYDNLEYLLVAGGSKRRGARGFEDLLDSGQIQVEPLTYIRGRSLPAQFVIVDEAQNLTPHEVKTIVTRCGEGTKIVLTGDPYQIDNPYVDATSNGLSLIADRLREEPLTGHILLTKGERSELANLAAAKL